VLNYSSSVDKVSELLGVGAPKVYEIYKAQAEGEQQSKHKLNRTLNKRNSQKALQLLGHDPSTEKVKKTLGIDEEEVHDVYLQNLNSRPRHTETSLNKKKYAKALTTLGFNLSLYKAKQLLGVDEEILRAVFRHHNEHALQEEHTTWRRALESKALRDKKHNRKALHVIGYDPSLEKALSMLGVGEGTREEALVGDILPVEKRQRSPRFTQATALVYALSAAIIITSLRHNLT
jgi:phosphohistidine phosphatase SixA